MRTCRCAVATRKRGLGDLVALQKSLQLFAHAAADVHQRMTFHVDALRVVQSAQQLDAA